MSRLDELIQEYCPNGVEFKPIKDSLPKAERNANHSG